MARAHFKNLIKEIEKNEKILRDEYDKEEKGKNNPFNKSVLNGSFLALVELQSSLEVVVDEVDKDFNTLFERIDNLEKICLAQSEFIKTLQEYVKEDDLELKQTMKKIITEIATSRS